MDFSKIELRQELSWVPLERDDTSVIPPHPATSLQKLLHSCRVSETPDLRPTVEILGRAEYRRRSLLRLTLSSRVLDAISRSRRLEIDIRRVLWDDPRQYRDGYVDYRGRRIPLDYPGCDPDYRDRWYSKSISHRFSADEVSRYLKHGLTINIPMSFPIVVSPHAGYLPLEWRLDLGLQAFTYDSSLTRFKVTVAGPPDDPLLLGRLLDARTRLARRARFVADRAKDRLTDPGFTEQHSPAGLARKVDGLPGLEKRAVRFEQYRDELATLIEAHGLDSPQVLLAIKGQIRIGSGPPPF